MVKSPPAGESEAESHCEVRRHCTFARAKESGLVCLRSSLNKTEERVSPDFAPGIEKFDTYDDSPGWRKNNRCGVEEQYVGE